MLGIPLDLLIAFIATCLIMEATPGPNMAFLAIVSASKGRKFGYATVMGITLGLALLGVVAAAGMATAIERSPLLYQALRWAGIGYLLWLAYEGWRETGESSAARASETTALRSYFRHGLIVNLLNPKAAAFYVTVLPTFVNRAEPIPPQALMLTLISVAIATGAHLLIVALSGSLQTFLTSPARNKIFRRAMSLMLAAVAIWFGWSTRA